MVVVETVNRSGRAVEEGVAADLARAVLSHEGVGDGELAIVFVGVDESRRLKREHLGIDEPADVLSFPLDGVEELPQGAPRVLGDVVLCPEVADDWRSALVHGVLHVLGYDHGPEMESRERALAGS